MAFCTGWTRLIFVSDNCGVVHIHKNVKVVGGSRAEDHMSRCAIADVYELHQHSQDLAAQCEPMSEVSAQSFTNTPRTSLPSVNLCQSKLSCDQIQLIHTILIKVPEHILY